MYFFIDTLDQSVVACKTLGNAARAALKKLNVPLAKEADPVKTANQALGDRGVLLNLSGMFEAIAESEGIAAQELAQQCNQAIEALYS